MIGLKSKLHVIDNTGALIAECIRTLNNAKVARVGDEIVVAVKKARSVSDGSLSSLAATKIRKGDVRRALIVRTKSPISRPDGRYIRFDDNACVLLNNQKQPLGTRILGLVASDIKAKGWTKVISLAPKII
ncbi:54S ribosomal protein L38, mitochondrial [Tieghemiomyces parasiticus]|uniref:Large ribosomal subunit protein uL14m n=1 Tax=Tieghemiomyces parasiticus TaxID=78921 RepID=A0A9W8AAH3_9FUNG|nr:54S ribosomal protein L38, mitochondrial [Tieghemiomyces parasiticus]